MTALVRLTVAAAVTTLILLLLALPTLRPTGDQVFAGGIVVLLGLGGFCGGLAWWISRHYIASAATGWRFVTWEEIEAAEACVGRWAERDERVAEEVI